MNIKKLPDAVILLSDNARGVYIPQFFAESCVEGWTGVTQNDRDCLLAGPYDGRDLYWDYWNAVLDRAEWMQDGFKWKLHQDGDLWAICFELMTDDQKQNFGFNED